MFTVVSILICDDCGDVLEMDDVKISETIASFTNNLGFQLSSQSIEATGICPGCRGLRLSMDKLNTDFVTGPLIELTDIEVRVGQKTLVTGISLSVEHGEVVSIIGPNGAGKTTLIKTLLGLIQPSNGEVTRRNGVKIGYMPQYLPIDRNMPLTARRFLDLAGRFGAAALRVSSKKRAFLISGIAASTIYREESGNAFYWPAHCSKDPICLF